MGRAAGSQVWGSGALGLGAPLAGTGGASCATQMALSRQSLWVVLVGQQGVSVSGPPMPGALGAGEGRVWRRLSPPQDLRCGARVACGRDSRRGVPLGPPQPSVACPLPLPPPHRPPCWSLNKVTCSDLRSAQNTQLPRPGTPAHSLGSLPCLLLSPEV